MAEPRFLRLSRLPQLSLAVFAIVIGLQITRREPVFNDELINLARTYVGLNAPSLAYDIFDYSLRPLFRLLNHIWRIVFGPELSALWLGSAIAAMGTALALQAATSLLKNRLAVATAPLLLLATPLFFRVGLGAMPHLVSAVFAVGALYFLLLWSQQTLEQQGGRSSLNAALCGALTALSLFTHPIQLVFVVSVICAFLTVGVMSVAQQRGFNIHVLRAIREATVAGVTFLILVFLLEGLYRATVFEDVFAANDRLLPGAGYSFLNLWVGNVFALDGTLANYSKPWTFYFAYLAGNHALFCAVTLLLTGLAFGLLVHRFVTGLSSIHEAVAFLPFIIAVVWLAGATATTLKTYYTLAAWTPLVAASNAAFVAYILQRTHFDPGKHYIGAGFLGILVAWTLISSRIQWVDFRREITKTERNYGVPYRIFTALPRGDVGMATGANFDGSANEGAEGKIRRACMTLARASSRPVHRIQIAGSLRPEQIKQIQSKIEIVCVTPTAIADNKSLLEELGREASLSKIYELKSGLSFWLPSGK